MRASDSDFDQVSDREDESSSCESEVASEIEPVDFASLLPTTTPPVTKKVTRPTFYSDRREVGQPRGRVIPNPKRAKSVNDGTPRARPRLSEPEVLSRAAADTSETSAVLSALGELTSTLNKVVKRLDKTEHRIQSMEEKIVSTSSASDSRCNAVKKVPVIVRVSCSSTVLYVWDSRGGDELCWSKFCTMVLSSQCIVIQSTYHFAHIRLHRLQMY